MAKSPAEQILDWIAQTAQERANPDATVHKILNQLLSAALGAMSQQVAQATNLVVQAGPFEELRYIPASVGSSLSPKLLGSYEAELHPLIQSFRGRGYRRIINLGCGEGYYAVGLARMLPGVPVFAFDADPGAQDLCRQLATLNGVSERVKVAGECRPADLAPLIIPKTLIFCDVEGNELKLLDLAAVPALASCDIVVELHDFLNPGISTEMTQRFARTHQVTLIPQGGRDPFAYPGLANLSQFDQFLTLAEGRPGPTPWAFMAART